MIAIIFAFAGVLGHDAGLERAALLHAARTHAGANGAAFDAPAAMLAIDRASKPPRPTASAVTLQPRGCWRN